MKKKTREQFIIEAKKIHGDKYDYSLVDYVGTDSKVRIICPVHGVFEQTPYNHMKGHGCPECAGVRKSKKTFLDELSKIDGYDYSMVVYDGAFKKIKIKCMKCGAVFEMTPHNFLRGERCPRCAGKNRTADEFFKMAAEKHSDKYDYSESEFKNMGTKIKIKCRACGKYFWQTPTVHSRGFGCPFCKESHGESKIEKILIENNIRFEREKRFKGCRDKRTLPFDFYLPDYNTVIEYQGVQHYKNVPVFKDGKNEIQRRDGIKRKYCIDNNIKETEISYFDDVEKKLIECLDGLRI